MQSAMHNQSASVFQFPKFSAPHEPAGFDGKLWSAAGGDEMGGG